MNPNLFIWTSDWHLVSDDSEHGTINETHPTDAGNVAAHIAALQSAGVIDTGDCKDHYGASTGDELDRYVEKVRSILPEMRGLPGNHDEIDDYNVSGAVTDFSLYDAKIGGPPYHWTLDWAAPQVRFIALHTWIHHSTDGYAGFFHIDARERGWLEAELAALPEGWQAIVCSHAPANPIFGNNIGRWFGGTELLALLAQNSSRIAAYLNGHRHGNMETHVLDGIKHFNGPGMSYTIGNAYGGWVPITYDPALRTLSFDFRLGPPSSYDRKAGYTPIETQLPPLEVPPPPPSDLELALAELRLTTVGYRNKYWTQPPVGTHWANALDLLESA